MQHVAAVHASGGQLELIAIVIGGLAMHDHTKLPCLLVDQASAASPAPLTVAQDTLGDTEVGTNVHVEGLSWLDLAERRITGR